MNQRSDGISNESAFRKIAILIIVIIIAIAVVFYVLPQLLKEEDNTPVFTSTYFNKTPEEAYNIINTTKNLTVIDCRGLEGCSICQFNKGHLPGAELNENPNSLFNSTEDILVYSVDGTVGAIYCADLVGHVYGKIYNLAGGYDAWVAAGFPV